MNKQRSYSDDWDEYVRNYKIYSEKEPTNNHRSDLIYPGDEWGKPDEWKRYSNKLLLPFLPEDFSGIAVEIGQGSGKYTVEVLQKAGKVICYDVSKEFLKVAANRLHEYILQNRVELELLNMLDCNEVFNNLRMKNLERKVDLFYSVDSMVHVELHTLIAYLIAAARSLKMYGYLVMSVASCCNESGFQRLLEETPWCFGGTRPSHQFYFLSKEIVLFLLNKLGFETIIFEEKRDINFAAKKIKDISVELKEMS